jgi:hypothetical protein
MKQYDRWSAAEDAELRRLRGEGRRIREIAERLDRSYHATRARIATLGLAKEREWTLEEDEVVRTHSYEEAAALLGRSVIAVQGRSWKLKS